MNKKYWIAIILIIILVAGALYLYLNRQSAETKPTPILKETTEETTEPKEAEDESSQSIPLEKPPFLKE